jgi:hypothetical protein
MLLQTLSKNVSGLVDTIIVKIAGGDLALICLTSTFQKGEPTTALDKEGLIELLED